MSNGLIPLDHFQQHCTVGYFRSCVINHRKNQNASSWMLANPRGLSLSVLLESDVRSQCALNPPLVPLKGIFINLPANVYWITVKKLHALLSQLSKLLVCASSRHGSSQCTSHPPPRQANRWERQVKSEPFRGGGSSLGEIQMNVY